MADWPVAQDPLSGLYLLEQVAAWQAAVEASLRWTPARRELPGRRAGAWSWPDHPPFSPGTELRLEAGLASAKWGANGSLAFRLGYDVAAGPGYTLTPELSLGAFFQASEAIRLVAEGEDLLSALSDGGRRLEWDPYVSPGIRATFKVQINL